MAFTGAINANGPSPQPRACGSPICSLTTAAGSNQAQSKVWTYFTHILVSSFTCTTHGLAITTSNHSFSGVMETWVITKKFWRYLSLVLSHFVFRQIGLAYSFFSVFRPCFAFPSAWSWCCPCWCSSCCCYCCRCCYCYYYCCCCYRSSRQSWPLPQPSECKIMS